MCETCSQVMSVDEMTAGCPDADPASSLVDLGLLIPSLLLLTMMFIKIPLNKSVHEQKWKFGNHWLKMINDL